MNALAREKTMSTRCLRCDTDNQSGARFCRQCGTDLNRMNQSVDTPPDSFLAGHLLANTVLADRYRIVRKLGQGGMGAVYLVADLRLAHKPWAIKEMSDAALPSAHHRTKAVRAFRREADMLATLEHPNLPKVIDFFSDRGKQYLVMEYIEGRTLRQYFDQHGGPLPEALVVAWAEKLCAVLAYLHEQIPPIIFRDLKPDNIMVRRDGEIKLIDFGIARHFKPGQTKDTLSFVSAGYAPIEQHGKGQTDPRSDIYALGATLHYLLTGVDPSARPFNFDPVQAVNPAVSPPLSQTIDRAVRLQPEERWQSMEEMRRAVSMAPTKPVPVSHPLPPTPPPEFTTVPIQPPVEPSRQMSHASYGKRVLASLLDGLFQGLIALFLYALLVSIGALVQQDPGSLDADEMQDIMDFTLLSTALFVVVFLWIFYLIRPTARSGRTLGKRMVGIRVVNGQHEPPGTRRTLVRYVFGFGAEGILSVLLIGLLGWLWPLWDDGGQAWHDKIAGTFVVEG